FRGAVLVQAPGPGETRAGAGGPAVRLVGAPGELVLFLAGRQRAARVQVDGPAEVAERLRGARLGL
ncbi:MAG TPA: TIGR03085 family protein, partial [Pilimelia sp.]|nr:TIGR03085 family protein [Pilimelia sp.]